MESVMKILDKLLSKETPRHVQSQELVSAAYRGLTLYSAFQKIVSVAHRRTVGFEALLRARDPEGNLVPPPAVFRLAESGQERAFLDRLARFLHVRNFCRQDFPDNTWLSLNLDPEVALLGEEDEFFSSLLQDARLAPERVIVEVLESQIMEKESRLSLAIEHYRSLGCLIAVDDFGAAYSNLHRTWQVAPDIVKVDRLLFANEIALAKRIRALTGLAEMLHEIGTLTVFEGIENLEELELAFTTGGDLLQGYFFGFPETDPQIGSAEAELVFTVEERLSEHIATSLNRAQVLRSYLLAMYDAAPLAMEMPQLEAGRLTRLLSLPRVLRVFLLDQNGFQVGPSLHAPQHQMDKRFLPLEATENTNWRHRPYFVRALAAPGEVQVSRPYFSAVGGAEMCLTLSLARQTPWGMRVLCCDILDKG